MATLTVPTLPVFPPPVGSEWAGWAGDFLPALNRYLTTLSYGLNTALSGVLGSGDGDLSPHTTINPEPGTLLRVLEGTSASPYTALGPLLEVTFISAQDATTQASPCNNPLNSFCFAPVRITVLNTTDAKQQATGIAVQVYGDTDNGGVNDGRADLCAGVFTSRKGGINGSGRGLSSGIYTEASRWDGSNNTVVGLEARVENRTATDCDIDSSEGSCFGVHISANAAGSGGLQGAAVNILAMDGYWQAGLMVQPTSISSGGAVIWDRSVGAGILMQVEGSKDRGIDTRSATFDSGLVGYFDNNQRLAWTDSAESDPHVFLYGDASAGFAQIGLATGDVTFDVAGLLTVKSLKTTGSAGGKNVVCVDTATGLLYASTTSTDCSS